MAIVERQLGRRAPDRRCVTGEAERRRDPERAVGRRERGVKLSRERAGAAHAPDTARRPAVGGRAPPAARSMVKACVPRVTIQVSLASDHPSTVTPGSPCAMICHSVAPGRRTASVVRVSGASGRDEQPAGRVVDANHLMLPEFGGQGDLAPARSRAALARVGAPRSPDRASALGAGCERFGDGEHAASAEPGAAVTPRHEQR